MSKKSPPRARQPIDYKERFLRKCVKIFAYADRMGFGTWDTMEEEEEFFVYGVVDWYPVRDILARLEEEQVGFNRVELLLSTGCWKSGAMRTSIIIRRGTGSTTMCTRP